MGHLTVTAGRPLQQTHNQLKNKTRRQVMIKPLPRYHYSNASFSLTLSHAFSQPQIDPCDGTVMKLSDHNNDASRHLHCQGKHQEGLCITISPSRHDHCHHNIHPDLHLFLKSLEEIHVFKLHSFKRFPFPHRTTTVHFQCFKPSFKLPY